MTLVPLEIYNGILFTIFVFSSIYLGLRIASKYFEQKRRVFLLVGFAWTFILCPCYPSTIAFFNALITGASPGLSAEIYFILGNVFIPIALLLWLIALTAEDPKIRLKGKLLIIALISYTIGTIIDAVITKNFLTLTIMRALEITSALEFYGGFILPKWMQKLFSK